MRSKMVNRNQLNDIAVKMGLKKISYFNKFDGSLKMSQIFWKHTWKLLLELFILTKALIKRINGSWSASFSLIYLWMIWSCLK